MGLIGSTCTALPGLGALPGLVRATPLGIGQRSDESRDTLATEAEYCGARGQRAPPTAAGEQGLTLVHFSAQHKHVLLDTLGA